MDYELPYNMYRTSSRMTFFKWCKFHEEDMLLYQMEEPPNDAMDMECQRGLLTRACLEGIQSNIGTDKLGWNSQLKKTLKKKLASLKTSSTQHCMETVVCEYPGVSWLVCQVMAEDSRMNSPCLIPLTKLSL